ncbi:MAG TPA: class A beta-lactamase-related serine hydrolase [Polyangiaceae bacterium]|nr:class A beta-lactamase-related serine hydrolase [Polyangiaceae bacterium]
MLEDDGDVLGALLRDAVEAGHPPAAQFCVVKDGRVAHQAAAGCTDDSIFDVASLTKVVATASAIAWLIGRGEVSLDDRMGRFLPRARADASLRELLAHRSGLPAWRPFFLQAMRDPVAGSCFVSASEPPSRASWARARSLVLDAVLGTPVEHPPARVYSDLGFITLGAIVEAVSGQRLDHFCAAHLHAGYDVGFVDLAADGPTWVDGRHVLPTGVTRPRAPAPGQEHLFDVPEQPPREDPGRVDDDNAFAMGGVAGHAGVFGTARAIAQFVYERWVMDSAQRDLFLAVDRPSLQPPRALGFDVPTAGSTAGEFGRGARVFGHLGFTGCSVWIDLDRRLSVALLTNRTLPGRQYTAGIRALRPRIHDAVAALF